MYLSSNLVIKYEDISYSPTSLHITYYLVKMFEQIENTLIIGHMTNKKTIFKDLFLQIWAEHDPLRVCKFLPIKR